MKDYGSATLRCKILSLPFLGLRQGRRDQILPSGNFVSRAMLDKNFLPADRVKGMAMES